MFNSLNSLAVRVQAVLQRHFCCHFSVYFLELSSDHSISSVVNTLVVWSGFEDSNKGNLRLASEDVFIRVVVDRANILGSRPVCSSEIHSMRQSSLLSSFPILTIHLRGSPNKPVVAAVWNG